ncbi:MAG: tRNA pseudouridine(55) synthase TruB [Ferruginibacter sp.]
MAKGSYFIKHKKLIHGETIPTAAKMLLGEGVRKKFEDGMVLLIDKPLHWTSFDIVRKIRNSIGIKKVGHAGTLDPLASGLLVVCTGKFTKRINEFMAAEKEYSGSINLGAVTPTYDLESTPQQFKEYNHISDDKIFDTTKLFTGDIMQVPPVYSAIKKNGIASYELARRGDNIKMEPRSVNIRSFEIKVIELPVIHFKIICSTGTYIRSVANDFGAALGCGGYLSSLRRTRIGDLLVEKALTMPEFIEGLNQKPEEK